MSIVTVPNLLVIGWKIANMASVLRSGLIMQSLKATLNKAKSMVLELSDGMMVPFI